MVTQDGRASSTGLKISQGKPKGIPGGSIETSNPAKYSIAALLSYRKADLIDFQGAAAHYLGATHGIGDSAVYFQLHFAKFLTHRKAEIRLTVLDDGR
jgi:hypothetical protein